MDKMNALMLFIHIYGRTVLTFSALLLFLYVVTFTLVELVAVIEFHAVHLVCSSHKLSCSLSRIFMG